MPRVVVLLWCIIGACAASNNEEGFKAFSRARTPPFPAPPGAGAQPLFDRLIRGGVKHLNDLRGGSSSSDILDSEEPLDSAPPSSVLVDASLLPPPSSSAPPLDSAAYSSPGGEAAMKSSAGAAPKRRASDVIDALIDRLMENEQLRRSSDEALRESTALRRLIMERTQDQLEEIQEALDISGRGRGKDTFYEEEWEDAGTDEDNDDDDLRLPDPRRLLSYLAPKVPAIRYSPDASLKIQCSPDSLDPGLAAAILASLARVVVVRDRAVAYLCDNSHDGIAPSLDSGDNHHQKERRRRRRHRSQQRKLHKYRDENMSPLIAKERRFEQLVECLACGIDVPKRLDEYARPTIDHDADAESIDDLLNGGMSPPSSSSDAKAERRKDGDAGLTARDAIRAAWGLSLLVGLQHPHETIGGEKVLDSLVALSLLVRDRLLSQMQELRLRDLSSVGCDVEGLVAILAEQLARDAASAMWAFSCVRACTGLRFAPLFEVGCVILCQNPYEVRRRAQEAESDASVTANVGASDVVDRLARAEDGDLLNEDPSRLQSASAFGASISKASRDTLLDYLSPNEVADVLWALALHGTRSHELTSQDEVILSETAVTLRDVICDRLIVWLQEERARVQSVKRDNWGDRKPASSDDVVDLQDSAPAGPEDANTAEVESFTIGSGAGESDGQRIEVLDAAAVLAAETQSQEDNVNGGFVSGKGSNILDSIPRSPPGNDRLLHLFSPRDLCSIAWAVAELHDSLQTSVTQVVKTIFAELGDHCLYSLDGRDLSNLAWAIAKSPGAAGSDDFDTSAKVVSWIANVLVPVEDNGRFISLIQLSRLQPPEIGRLVWAVATIESHSDAPVDQLRESSSRLALAALSVAKENLHEYGAEDLVRCLRIKILMPEYVACISYAFMYAPSCLAKPHSRE
jgi:hypothetical protein